MKFIVDENLPARVAAWLKAAGHEAWHVSELGLLGQTDVAIWAEAGVRAAFVLSRDRDFIILAQQAARGGCVRLLIGNCPTPVLIARIEALWPEVERLLAAGERVIEIG